MRFLMALEIVVGHSTYFDYVGTHFVFWFAFPYMQTAVIGFYVLSGFVIGFVVDQKERTGVEYAAARIGRLYSVVIPALALTLLCDTLGQLANPGAYLHGPATLADHNGEFSRYVATFFLINNFGIFPHDMVVGTNGPFWTMSYEMTYYVLFGLLCFGRSAVAWCVAAAFAILAGTQIMLLAPVWLLGVATYHVQKRRSMPQWLAIVILIATVIGLERLGWMRRYPASDHPYIEASLFALNILSAASLARPLELLLGKAKKTVTWLGSLTFALYLCHRPLLQVLSVYRIGVPGSPMQNAWLFGGCFLVVICVAAAADSARYQIRKAVIA